MAETGLNNVRERTKLICSNENTKRTIGVVRQVAAFLALLILSGCEQSQPPSGQYLEPKIHSAPEGKEDLTIEMAIEMTKLIFECRLRRAGSKFANDQEFIDEFVRAVANGQASQGKSKE